MDYSDSSSEEEEAPPIFECALAELLRAGVAEDVGPQLQKFMDAPATVAEAYALLPPNAQEQLDCFLPAFDVARSDRLRNPALTEAHSIKPASPPPELNHRATRQQDTTSPHRRVPYSTAPTRMSPALVCRSVLGV